MVGLVVPQEQLEQKDSASDDIKVLFGDFSKADAAVPAMTDEQVALLPSYETTHHEQVTRQFMATEREALLAMLMVRANTAREAACVAAQEEAARGARGGGGNGGGGPGGGGSCGGAGEGARGGRGRGRNGSGGDGHGPDTLRQGNGGGEARRRDP
jgi:hypothetical protein